MTRRISMTTRKELVAALQLRYGGATFGDRIRILDEFVAERVSPQARHPAATGRARRGKGDALAQPATTRRYVGR